MESVGIAQGPAVEAYSEPPAIRRLLHTTNPAMVMPVWRSGKCNVCYKGHAALLKGFGQLSECLCFDSHCCYLVRFTAFINPDRLGNRGIHFFDCGFEAVRLHVGQ